MSASTNRRRPSPDAADTTGHSYQLILEHILTYPGSYTLGQPPTMPLRSNSTRSRPKLTQQWSSSSRPVTPTLNPRRPAFSPPPDTGTPSPDVAAAAAFTTTLLNHIGNSPSQPCSLPPIFTASFLRNCFPSELHLVGFPQALEGLEYLEDLNRRRRREVAGAKRRIGLRDGAAIDAAEGSKSSDAVKAWVRDVENSERKAEALFTQLFVALRRWVCSLSFVSTLSLMQLWTHMKKETQD